MPTPLLTSAGARLLIAVMAVLGLWGAVLWAILAPPPPPPSARLAAPAAPSLRLVVAAGQAAPTGGSFDRFDIESQPIVAPINASGHVAFYATLVRTKAREGIFLATGSRIVKVAAIGDVVAGGGILSEFAKHPVPALNDADKLAFGASVAGARATEGVFLASEGTIKVIALSGADAPGIATGTFIEFDTPALNNWDEVTFVATVRHGRETLEALYLYSAGKLRKLVVEGDLTPRGGTFSKFGVPVINNKGVIAFPAVLEHGPVLGGLFVAGTRDLRLLVGAGENVLGGMMLLRFSERVAINDNDHIAFGAQVRSGDESKEAVLLADASGIEQVAIVGDSAPGGGRFSGFGPWPSLGPDDMVAFIAAIEEGPGALGLFVSQAGQIRRVAMAGDHWANGKVIPPFALNPVATAGPNKAVTFATMAEVVNQNGIYYYGPPPKSD